ncbi:MAG: Rossmann-like domain-containing protein [Gammaproteobacteria bacterium]
MVSSLSQDYLELGGRLVGALGEPVVTGLYLPVPLADETFRDEFGFVFLDSGDVGAFYVSMGGILRELWRRCPEPSGFRAESRSLQQGFESDDWADRALALGTFNALSAKLFRASGFQFKERGGKSGLAELDSQAPVGMVGYFKPLVDKLSEQGCTVLVLEQAPERIEQSELVLRIDHPRELTACSRVLCTAATLINDSLDWILEFVPRGTLELIGPSGSGLPDPLFKRGVTAVGGTLFPRRDALIHCLESGEPWGRAGKKVQLDAAAYPGVDGLMQRLAASGS